jgi:hypothetical protein
MKTTLSVLILAVEIFSKAFATYHLLNNAPEYMLFFLFLMIYNQRNRLELYK